LTNFYNVLPVDFVKKFATQWHAHYAYYVATLLCKVEISKNLQYLQMVTRSSNNFLEYWVKC